MLGAGQDIDRALRFLVETAPNRRVGARDGPGAGRGAGRRAAGDRAGQQPRSFPRLYIGLVRAGEAGGTLAATLERLATLMERERSLAVHRDVGDDLPGVCCWSPRSARSRCC